MAGAGQILLYFVQIGDADCRNDYLLIPGGWGGTDVANFKFSRDRLTTQ